MKKLMLAAIFTAGLAATGCAGASTFVVRMGPPPPPRYGIIGVAPGPGYVWAEGYHDWRGGAWVWVPGRWVIPPRPHYVWVPGQWVSHGHGYRFRPGHWRH